MLRISFALFLGVFIAGCASNIVGTVPQTPDELISIAKTGHMFTYSEKVILNSPYKSVIANLSEYSGKCLNLKMNYPGSFLHKQGPTSTTYKSSVKTEKDRALFLSQHHYGSKEDPKMPAGGLYGVVAEIKPASSGKTTMDIYSIAGQTAIVSELNRWAAGNKENCPSFKQSF